MDIADPEAVLATLREFRELLGAGYGDEEANARAVEMQPTIEKVAKRLDPDNVGRLSERTRYGGWDLGAANTETLRLIGILENHEVIEQMLGTVGPALAANRLHRWVWHAAVNLWDGEHYKQAVNAAAAAVEEQTQLKLDLGNLSGTKLYSEAFRLDTKPGERKLRFTHLTEKTADGNLTETWKSAHQGAMNFGQGCALGIRNLNAHGTGELAEQEALEYLAALSVLARWVDECDAVGVADAAPGA